MNFLSVSAVYLDALVAQTAVSMPPATTPITPAPELRARVAALRHDLSAATDAYYRARREGRGQDVIALLRRRSRLIRQLFETQSELLLVLRSRPEENEPAA